MTDQISEDLLSSLRVDAITCSLSPLVAAELLSSEHADELMKCAQELRRKLARDLGIVINGIHFRDDIYIDTDGYWIALRRMKVAKGRIYLDHLFVIDTPEALAGFQGIDGSEPGRGRPAKWIARSEIDKVRDSGALIFDHRAVIFEHLAHVVAEHAHDIIRFEDFCAFLAHFTAQAPDLLAEFERAIPRRVSFRAYRMLLHEQVWPRDPIAMFEAMLEVCGTEADPALLAEAARKKLVPLLLLSQEHKSIPFCKVDAALEEAIEREISTRESLLGTDLGISISKSAVAFAKNAGQYPFVLCSPKVRRYIAELFFKSRVKVRIFATDEIPKAIHISTHSNLSVE